MADLVKELNNLDFSNYIGGPLQAAVEAQKVEQTALSTIDVAQNILYNISTSLLEKIEQVRALIRQIMIPAKEAGLLQNAEITDFNQYIESLLQ